jgi:hypothetical protein
MKSYRLNRRAGGAREVVSFRMTQEVLGNARCPICRAILVARQGRVGPYFYCRCVRRRAS